MCAAVERRVRVLEDDLERAHVVVGRACRRGRRSTAPSSSQRAALVGRRDAEHDPRERRLARARLADQAERLARPQLGRHAGQRVHVVAGLLERLRDVDRRAGSARPRATTGGHRRRRTASAAAASAPPRGSGSGCARPPPRSYAGGGSVRQRSRAIAQRSTNTQPGRSAPGGGRKPGIVSSRPWSLRWPRRGMQRSRPTVYGWRGSSNTSRAVPSSTIAPAYSTPTRSHIFAITPRLCEMNSTAVSVSRAQLRDEVEHLRLDGGVERRWSARRGSAASG